MNIFYLIIYNIVLLIFFPLILLYIIWALIVSDHTKNGFAERIGYIKKSKIKGKIRVLIHAVSVGETVAEKPIWQELKPLMPNDVEIIHSVTTDTGYKIAQKDFVAIGGDELVYFPLDFLPSVLAFLLTVRPKTVMLVETELWPNFLAVSKLLNIKIVVANGRISERSLRGGKIAKPIYKWMTSNIDLFLMQSEVDKERIITLGADPERAVVVGNSKFDMVNDTISLIARDDLKRSYNLLPDDKIILAGSTHDTEENSIMEAYVRLKTVIPHLRLIIAPRDISRAEVIINRAKHFNLSTISKTQISSTVVPQSSDIIILDTIGELSHLYSIADVAFVGGSLVPVGGHNILEASIYGVPVVFGKYMTNFRDIASIVVNENIGKMVENQEELFNALKIYLFGEDKQITEEKNREIFSKYSGASEKTAKLTKLLLDSTFFEK